MLESARSNAHKARHSALWRLHIDLPLLLGLLVLIAIGLVVLYSASGENIQLIHRQVIRLALAIAVMFFIAQIPPRVLKAWAVPLYVIGISMLILVMFFGVTGKGAQRWLDLGLFRFQPSEIMKIALPMMLAWYLSERNLPPRKRYLFVASLIILIPTLLIANQPDLGTALLIASSGLFVFFLSGISWKLISGFAISIASFAPIAWNFLLHDYQRDRVLIFLDPSRDPLGNGYHIIQSKIAIGSGGLYGKGWLNGTQSQLEFLPERHTDFIFSVLGEEFGFFGILLLLLVYLFIIGRGLYIGTQAQDTFTRLLAGSLILTFFVYVFVNIGMVTGLLPVVGLPLPLVSYGGTAMVTMMASMGILMGIRTHRRLHSS
ncbi:MAG: rod shape-determining protein RodA [Gammaproteobacteria bacterium]|nr:MAG: rod shape-determining protein RodA [Gammaproteobacteria bacterium]